MECRMVKLTYCQAIQQTLAQEMEQDPSIILYGVGLPTRDQFFGSVRGLHQRFGGERVIDTPVAEESMLGFGLGVAVNGLRPVMHHIRVDFLLLAMNQLVNMIAPYSYQTLSKLPIPLVIRVVVGRGWGQGWQHSKSLHSIFAHIPGLRVVLPTTPRQAKGLLTSALRGSNPTLIIEHRWLYDAEDEVPEGDYQMPLDRPDEFLRTGNDLTITATSWMAVEALHAAKILETYHRVYADVVNPISINPLSIPGTILSVRNSGYAIVADNDWAPCGLGAELSARITEGAFDRLKAPPRRVGWAFTPCPTVRCLEDEFYPNARTIVREAEALLGLPKADLTGEEFYSHSRKFKGPF